MTVQSFVNKKAKQLCFYLRSFWQGELPVEEIELFFWDSMEEWGQIEYTFTQPYTYKERVFWHLLHQVHFWQEDKLRSDQYLVDELMNCVLYLEGKGHCPIDCVGIRP
ncbi:hypothetical protein Q4561_01720 [Alteromonas sp. 1_MG-2023]|uniref:hypothetical protein n=1 Tax=Alteromonas sp. 1_MG-2023 TaxID=3062669 RepID=UPI0026E42A92|nr:hypothetical protein [Alteromonas sp. 1_MG-2023]MDO6565767.1 hypothetical protein [Alteromonas sp. 1_MG-2023]